MGDLQSYSWVRNRAARELLVRQAQSQSGRHGGHVCYPADDYQYPYTIETDELLPRLGAKVIQNSADKGTKRFLQQCEARAAAVPTLFFNACAQSVLRLCASVTTVNGILNRGKMWVLSREQFALHLHKVSAALSRAQVLSIDDR